MILISIVLSEIPHSQTFFRGLLEVPRWMQQECVDLQGFVMLLAQILDQTPTPPINKDENTEQLYDHVKISPYQYVVKGVPQR